MSESLKKKGHLFNCVMHACALGFNRKVCMAVMYIGHSNVGNTSNGKYGIPLPHSRARSETHDYTLTMWPTYFVFFI